MQQYLFHEAVYFEKLKNQDSELPDDDDGEEASDTKRATDDGER